MKYLIFIFPLLFISCTEPNLVVRDRVCYESNIDISDYEKKDFTPIKGVVRGGDIIIKVEDMLVYIREAKECKKEHNSLIEQINIYNSKISNMNEDNNIYDFNESIKD